MPGQLIATVPAIVQALASRRTPDTAVVLTNGVFDLLHVGHLRYLQAARELGDLLVVGVNGDESARRQKRGRPYIPAAERAELVAALAPVDLVVIFTQLTASSLVRAVRPQIYAKGGDYDPDTLPERAAARAVGARIVILPLVAGRSTTQLVSRILQAEIGPQRRADPSAS